MPMDDFQFQMLNNQIVTTTVEYIIMVSFTYLKM